MDTAKHTSNIYTNCGMHVHDGRVMSFGKGMFSKTSWYLDCKVLRRNEHRTSGVHGVADTSIPLPHFDTRYPGFRRSPWFYPPACPTQIAWNCIESWFRSECHCFFLPLLHSRSVGLIKMNDCINDSRRMRHQGIRVCKVARTRGREDARMHGCMDAGCRTWNQCSRGGNRGGQATRHATLAHLQRLGLKWQEAELLRCGSVCTHREIRSIRNLWPQLTDIYWLCHRNVREFKWF